MLNNKYLPSYIQDEVLLGFDNDRLKIISTLNKDGKAYHVLHLVGDHASFKAYQLYAAFIRQTNAILITTGQSFGGLKTWQWLSTEPGIEVYGWDRKKQKSY